MKTKFKNKIKILTKSIFILFKNYIKFLINIYIYIKIILKKYKFLAFYKMKHKKIRTKI